MARARCVKFCRGEGKARGARRRETAKLGMSPALYPSPHDGQRPAATATMPSLRAVQLELLQDRLSDLAGQLALVRWGARPEGRVGAPRLNANRERDRLVL